MTVNIGRNRLTRFARLTDDPLTALNVGWRHWESFCYRFRRPKLLSFDTTAEG